MMPAAEGMSHVIPSHVLRVGQTICLGPTQGPISPRRTSSPLNDTELDTTLENLNQLILDLDPSFEPLQVNRNHSCTSPQIDSLCSDSSDDVSHCVLVSRGCPPRRSPTVGPSVSPSIPIPTQRSFSCSPHGTPVFSSSPTSSLPPLPFGSAPRRNASVKQDASFPPGSLCMSGSKRNSAASILSTSTCSDTSYFRGSNLSLAGEDGDSPEYVPASTPGSFGDGSRFRPFDGRPLHTKHGHLFELQNKGAHSSPASLCSSQTDIPLLLINGAPESQLDNPAVEADLIPVSTSKQRRSSFKASFSGSQPCMKFIMETSRFWFRPHISRAEAEALLKDKDAGTFVVRDSTSFRGSFGLAMKVNQSPTFSAAPYPGENGSDLIRHFLIESSAKGVRIKGSSQEPYFGSLSALVYQHTVSACALPCRLLLHYEDLESSEKKRKEKAAEEKRKIACNFVYLNAVPTEMLTGPCAVQRAVSSTLGMAQAPFKPTIVNMKVSQKGVTLTDINRKLFFRRHYPAHLLSYSGEDPDKRQWWKGSSFGARMFGFVAKGIEAGAENVCHVFAEYDPLQPCTKVLEIFQDAITSP